MDIGLFIYLISSTSIFITINKCSWDGCFLLPCTSRVLSFSDKVVAANGHLHHVMCGSVLHDFEVYTI